MRRIQTSKIASKRLSAVAQTQSCLRLVLVADVAMYRTSSRDPRGLVHVDQEGGRLSLVWRPAYDVLTLYRRLASGSTLSVRATEVIVPFMPYRFSLTAFTW